jgi:type II secretory pathway pseudopilin PulG
MIVVLKSRKAMTLVEVMIAVLVLVIMILGSVFLFAYGSGHITQSKNFRVATELASQKLELFRAINNYGDINNVQADEVITMSDATFNRRTEVTDVPEVDPLYKKVKVTVQWSTGGRAREVELNTLYVKR